jgi:nicotinamide riboside kinase
MPTKNYTKYLFFILLLFTFAIGFSQNQPKFKVVLDAGHGGEDPGAVKNGIKEKDIVLDVVLKIGKILESNKNIEIIYTRKTDVFIGLKERANIANKAKANLFVSVHCNGVKSTAARGTETFVMGMSRTDTNLDIAKKENGVIFLEKNYNEKYKGFDPNNPETLLGLKILQEEFLLKTARRFLFCDTSPITLKIWAQLTFKEVPHLINDMVANRTYDHYLITNNDIEWEADLLRQNLHAREMILQHNISEVSNTNKPYTVITGRGDERLGNALEILEALYPKFLED